MITSDIKNPSEKYNKNGVVGEERELYGNDKNIEKDEEEEKGILVEKYLFFIGIILPIAWFIGSTTRSYKYSSYIWKKRCRIAATLCLTVAIVIAAIVMVVNPKLFGLKTDIGAQTSSASNDAIRPGVPIIGTNDWGDTVAGIGIDDNYQI
jgi:hypothetical protein